MPVEALVSLTDERAVERRLLHARLPRAVKRVRLRPPGLPAEPPQQAREGEGGPAHLQGQRETPGPTSPAISTVRRIAAGWRCPYVKPTTSQARVPARP